MEENVATTDDAKEERRSDLAEPDDDTEPKIREPRIALSMMIPMWD